MSKRAVILIGLALTSCAPADEDAGTGAAQNTKQAASGSPAVRGDAKETSDVRLVKCANDSIGYPTATLAVTNSSSKASNYLIEVSFESKDGKTKFATGNAVVQGLEPGQTTQEEASALKELPAGSYTCRVSDVDRLSAAG